MLKILFFGTPDFSLPALRSLISSGLFSVAAVVTQPDRHAGRGKELKASPVKLLALENNLPVYQPERLKGYESEFISRISGLGEIDFGVVIAFGQILPAGILDYPKYGCINIHASLLPRWRGAAPIQRAILAGDHETGVCIMKMETGLDTGPVYSRRSLAISDSDTSASLFSKLSGIGAELLIETLPQIADGSITAEPQGESGVTYADKITPKDLMINWSLDSLSILRKVRAFSPKPGACSWLDGKRVKIIKAAEVPETYKLQSLPAPGLVRINSDRKLLITTGSGAITVSELQLEGKRAMPADEFIKGFAGLDGKVLGI